MMMGRRWVLALTAMVSLNGCGVGGADEAAGEPYRSPTLPELRDHARRALARFDEAAGKVRGTRKFVPVGDLTEVVGEPEADGDDLKRAVLAGRLFPAGALPATSHRSGTITWADGVSRTVSVISAEEALAAHRQGAAGCGGCAPFNVIDSRPVTMQVRTSAGEATVPAWEYVVKGTALRARYAAVGGSDVVTVTPPPWDSNNPPAGNAIETASSTINSTRMTVSFTGALGPASEPCGEDYHAEAIESDNAVIVILMVERRHNDGDESCTLVGYPRTETVSLSRPLGERAVLEGQQGTPVTVKVTH